MRLRSECGVTEEQLVDLLRAGASGGETEAQAALRRHAETCASCALQLREWEALLGGFAPAPRESAAPPAALRQRLFAAVRRRAPLRRAAQAVRLRAPRELLRALGQRQRGGSALPAPAAGAAHGRPRPQLRRERELLRCGQLSPQANALPAVEQRLPHSLARRRKHPYLFGTAAAAAALLYIGSLCAIRERLGDPAMAGVPTLAQVQDDNEIMANMGLVVQAKTAQFPVQSRGSEQARGVAWVNDDSEEMLLLVEGLPSLPGQDYRVWSVRQDSRTPLGTLRLVAGKAHLHYHGAELHGADAISVSREPTDETANGAVWPGIAEVASVKLK